MAILTFPDTRPYASLCTLWRLALSDVAKNELMNAYYGGSLCTKWSSVLSDTTIRAAGRVVGDLVS